jgi:pSer/pThr/pTyr-binding forkhead associated (FHA) protein
VDGLTGATFPLEPGETVFGRTDGGIRIPNDGTISPRHARFTVRDGGLVVEDMGSLNGTYVRIQGPRRIALGAEFRVGRQLLRVEPLPRPAAPEGSARTWGARDPGCRFRVAQLLEGGGVGEIHPLREGENTVGREAGDVTFPGDRYVSGRHARLEVSGDDVTLADLGSSNGTFVRIAVPTPLVPGDQLLVGTQLLRVDGSTGSAPAP